MQCVVSTCGHESTSTSSSEITYFRFPLKPSLRTAWLKAMYREDWHPGEDSVVCSKHFRQEDFLESSSGLRNLRPDAVPVINVQVCRICFAIDCKLYPMIAYTVLYKAYENLTGLLIQKEDKLPPYLCNECAHQLLKCTHFRTKSLEAHSILQEIYMKHNCITLESIQSVHGIHNPLTSEYTRKNDVYDIDMELTQIENINNEQTDINASCLLDNVTIECVKEENDDVSDNIGALTSDVMVYVSVRNLQKHAAINSYKNFINADDTIEGATMDVNLTSGAERHNDKQSADTAQRIMMVPQDTNKTNVDTHKDIEVTDDSLPLKVNQRTKKNNTREKDMRKVSKYISHRKVDTHRKSGAKDGFLCSDQLFCDKCPFITLSKINLSSHLKAHAAPKSYNCAQCNYKTIYKRSLIWHSRVHSGEKPYHCDRCNKTFSQKGSLLIHLRQHSGKKPYSCNICTKTFSELSTLRRHIRTHSDEKPYVCDICNKAFRQKGHLKNHLRVHAGDKPFFCDFCKKGFSQKGHLKTHLRVHSGDLQNVCDICKKVFRHDNTLKRHMRKHYSAKSHSCVTCKKVFSRRSCLRVHLKKHCSEK